MAIFGDKEEKIKMAKLKKENEELREQISEYEKVFGNFEDMKRVTDRVREENKRLLQKLEEQVEIKRKLERRVEELNKSVDSKKEKFLSTIYSIEAKNDDVIIGNNLILAGGIRTNKSIKTGEGVIVNGTISCDQMLMVGDKNHITGDINAEKSLKTGNNCTFDKDIRSKGTIETGEFCELKNVISDSDIYVGKGSKAIKISSKGNVYLKDGVSIEKGIEYKDAISIGQNVSISGEIKTIKTK